MLKTYLVSLVSYAAFSLLLMAFGVPYNSWWQVMAAIPALIVVLVYRHIMRV